MTTIHSLKKGIMMDDFLRYGSIENKTEDVSQSLHDYLQVKWKCPRCEISFLMNRSSILEHLSKCQVEIDEKDREEKTKMMNQELRNENRKTYYCEVCQQPFELSGIEFLRHKNSHRSEEIQKE
jgi:hypothetical protein